MDLTPVVDPIKNPGDPNTVTLPETGNTLSLPKEGEGIWSYYERTRLQTGGPAGAGAGITYATPANPAIVNDWPRRVDEYAGIISGQFIMALGGNPYLTDEQGARARELAAIEANRIKQGGRGSIPADSLSPAERYYIYRNFSLAYDVLSGTRADVANAINAGGYSSPPDANGKVTLPNGDVVDAGGVRTELIEAVTSAIEAAKTSRAAREQRLSAKHPHRGMRNR